MKPVCRDDRSLESVGACIEWLIPKPFQLQVVVILDSSSNGVELWDYHHTECTVPKSISTFGPPDEVKIINMSPLIFICFGQFSSTRATPGTKGTISLSFSVL